MSEDKNKQVSKRRTSKQTVPEEKTFTERLSAKLATYKQTGKLITCGVALVATFSYGMHFESKIQKSTDEKVQKILKAAAISPAATAAQAGQGK